MKIGLLTASVSRRAGGLYDATRHLAHALHALALDVTVFGLADPDTERDQPGWDGLPVQTVAVRGPRFFGYAPALSPALQRTDLDLLHTHGLWMYPSVAGQHWRRRQ
jgi:poly(glycerol-phosphate) alpha-glucosyltransferase